MEGSREGRGGVSVGWLGWRGGLGVETGKVREVFI